MAKKQPKRDGGDETQAEESNGGKRPVCGLVMPISEIDDCPEHHWAEVKDILSEAVTSAGFEPNMVSDADDVGVIQERIVRNLYENPIAVCDVSAKNPNVMFELGLRLAFDKATVIVKDDVTNYSFDTQVIEHVSYPRDLRFPKIVAFKNELVKKIRATYQKSIDDPEFSPFVRGFGPFKVAKIDTVEVPATDLLFEEMRDLKRLVSNQILPHKRGRSRELAIEYVEKALEVFFNEHDSINPESQFGDIVRSSRSLAAEDGFVIPAHNIVKAVRDELENLPGALVDMNET